MEKQKQECKLEEMTVSDWIWHLAIQNRTDKLLRKDLLIKQTLGKEAMMKLVLAHEIRKELHPDGKVYCTLNLVSGYHQVKIAEEYCDYTTFILSSRCYRFTDLPMGLVSSGNIFDNNTDTVTEGVI